MQVRELIDELANYESDTEVYIYTWDNIQKKATAVKLNSLEEGRMGLDGIFLLAEDWPECMVGGHDDGCLCNLGFTARWR